MGHSTDSANGASGAGDTARVIERVPISLKPNSTRFSGTVDSIDVADSVNCKVWILVSGAAPTGGIPSLAEAGSVIIATFAFVKDSTGAIDPANDRNKRLKSVLSMKKTDAITGTARMESPGRWVLVDIEVR
ncbi:MAG TPA: hypothetical protein VKS81_00145 [Bacteroidota bacterium]|nr:hypothetical protein [Bacteroidota bacterium]